MNSEQLTKLYDDLLDNEQTMFITFNKDNFIISAIIIPEIYPFDV